jgi:hypothetical protein
VPDAAPWECPRCHCLFERPGYGHEPCGDPAAAILAGIRENFAARSKHAQGLGASPADFRLLLAAVERALKLADELDAEAAQADARAQRADERGADSACAVLYARATALNEGARRSREAITAALTGAPGNEGREVQHGMG